MLCGKNNFNRFYVDMRLFYVFSASHIPVRSTVNTLNIQADLTSFDPVLHHEDKLQLPMYSMLVNLYPVN